MSTTDDFKAIVKRLRGWGFTVSEYSGCYGRSNGTSWTHGKPVWHTNHHYVCSMNPEQSYIDSLVSSLAANATVNWFADVNGRAYLLGTGPMNHAGTGNSYVLDRLMHDQACLGLANGSGDMSGNQTGSGTEGQHPGDSTPWPTVLLEVMYAINAAEFMQWGYTANRAANHYSWTDRKIDMSHLGGPNSGNKGGQSLVDGVKKRMGGGGSTPPPPVTPTTPPNPVGKYTNPPGPFALPGGHYYGDIDGPAESHGGYYSEERPYVKWIQIRMQELGYAPTSSGWADGLYEQPTIDSVSKWQHARHASTTSLPGQVWGDDWHNLETDR
jgi:hypothetical protein